MLTKLIYKIEQDTDGGDFADPRQNDNAGTIDLLHKRYNFANESGIKDPEALTEHINAVIKSGGAALTVYGYDHGGITISTTPYSCPWDSGKLGYIHMTKETMKKEGFKTKKKALKLLESEIEEYNYYVSGEVYNVSIQKVNAENEEEIICDNIDACGGYLGYKYAKTEAENMLKYAEKSEAEKEHKARIKAQKKLKALIINHIPLEARQAQLKGA